MKRKLLIAGLVLAVISSCKMENPLLTESTAPFGAPQFDKIRNEHYLPAFEQGIAEAKAEIDAIVANQEEPTFENTIEAMEYAGHYFNILGVPERTQYWTRRVQKEAYRLGAFGFCGNEDVGQLSAWYVLSAIGFAQVCPGNEEYYINTPLFRKARISLDRKYHTCANADTFTVECDKDPLEYPYISEMYLNGVRLDRYYLTYSEITAGGKLEFKLKK